MIHLDTEADLGADVEVLKVLIHLGDEETASEAQQHQHRDHAQSDHTEQLQALASFRDRIPYN